MRLRAASDREKRAAADIRVVFGAYCSQVDETNIAMLRHIYDGDDPAPFADQFTELPMREVHWTKTGNASLRHPEGGSVDYYSSEQKITALDCEREE